MLSIYLYIHEPKTYNTTDHEPDDVSSYVWGTADQIYRWLRPKR